jgi:chemotaxis protein CheD
MIGTLLGSCVAVCLHDPEKKISGMNHFMLPGRISKADIFKERTAKYGITAIGELLDGMLAVGCSMQDLWAKVFGGGSVMEFKMKTNSIPSDNVRLARLLLEMEDIPITEVDVGGNYTRKLLFEVKSGRVFLKKTTSRDVYEKVETRDKNILERVFGEI